MVMPATRVTPPVAKTMTVLRGPDRPTLFPKFTLPVVSIASAVGAAAESTVLLKTILPRPVLRNAESVPSSTTPLYVCESAVNTLGAAVVALLMLTRVLPPNVNDPAEMPAGSPPDIAKLNWIEPPARDMSRERCQRIDASHQATV